MTAEILLEFRSGRHANNARRLMQSLGDGTVGSLTNAQHLLVCAWLVGHLFLASAQRAGAIRSMTMLEYESKEVEGEFEVVSIRHHKTYYSGGAATVPLDASLKSLLDIYINKIRRPLCMQTQHRQLQDKDVVFVNPSGSGFTSSALSNLIPRSMGLNITATTIRKTVATQVREHYPNMTIDAAIQMSHSVHMQETTYSVRNKVKVCVKVSRVMKGLWADMGKTREKAAAETVGSDQGQSSGTYESRVGSAGDKEEESSSAESMEVEDESVSMEVGMAVEEFERIEGEKEVSEGEEEDLVDDLGVNDQDREDNLSMFSEATMSTLSARTTASSGRRAFTPKDAEVILHLFESEIAKGACPTQSEINESASQNQILKELVTFYSVKRIADRIRCFIRAKK